RNIARADATLKGGTWDRKNLEGVELYNKTLGIIGMGRIGSELSRRAIAFGMRVLAFDPYLSASRARSLQVELVEELDELLAAAAKNPETCSDAASRCLDRRGAGERGYRNRAVHSRSLARGNDSQRRQHADARRENTRPDWATFAFWGKTRPLSLAACAPTRRFA